MPTGYTADINAGTSFREFALRCARGMGACIMMREDPMDAPIPDEFLPGEYYVKAVPEAQERVSRVLAMTDAEKEAGALAEFRSKCRDRAETKAKSDSLRRQYERMLRDARDWKPPTADHKGLRDFMIQQLEESIRFDCHDDDFLARCYPEPMRLGPGDWWQKKVIEAEEALARAKENLREETERQATRSRWIRQLRESL